MRKKNRTFLSFLASYILIAFIPMCVSVFMYSAKVEQNITSAALDNAMSISRQSMAAVETQLELANNIPASLFSNAQITHWSLKNDPYARRNVIAEIRQLIGGSDSILDVFLFLRGSDMLVSGYNSVCKIDMIRKNDAACSLYYENWPYEDQLEVLNSLYKATVRGAERLLLSGVARENVITFLNTLPSNNRYAYATVLVLVSGNALSKLVLSGDGRVFALFSQDGTYIHGSGETPAFWAEAAALAKGNARDVNAMVTEMMGEKRLISWAKSMSQGWTLIQMEPLANLLNQYRQVRVQAFLLMLALSAVLAVLIYSFMRLNYYPIRWLTNMVGDVVQNSDSYKNSFDLLSTAVNRLKTENKRLTNHLNDVRPQLRDAALRNLLYGRPDDDSPLVRIDIVRKGAVYQVLAFAFEEETTCAEAVEEIERGAPARQGITAACLANGKELMVLCVSDPQCDRIAVFTALIKRARVGIGSVVSDADQIADSCVLARQALNYACLRCPIGVCMQYGDVPDSALPTARSYPMELMQALSMAVAQGSGEVVRERIQEVALIIQSRETPPYLARALFYQAVSVLIEGLRDDMEKTQVNEIAASAMLSQQPAYRMNELMTTLADHFAQIAAERRQQLQNLPIGRALRYIDAELSKPDLSLRGTADAVNLSVSHFTLLFKKEVNRTFKEYVDALRVQRARELLSETDLLVADVARKVGYENSYSFSRLFKNHTGFSPMEYRQRSCETKEK